MWRIGWLLPRRGWWQFVVLYFALYAAALLLGCSTTHTIVSPECPPDDSLATQRHALGCGVYAPKDTTP